MNKRIHIINPKKFDESLSEMDSGKKHIASINNSDFFIEQYETVPLPGLELPQGFPNCCPTHVKIAEDGQSFYEAFPNCCEGHKNLLSASWFRKEDFNYLPKKFLYTTTYTWDCIARSILNENWYKEITDYITYTIGSFGQFPTGFGNPLGASNYLLQIEGMIEANDIPAEKKRALLEFTKECKNPEVKSELTDLNDLIAVYKEWLNIFPFDLSLFKHLKAHFEKSIPILADRGETNIYTGMTGFRVKTKQELLSFLISVTQTLITQINGMTLFQEASLTETQKYQKELLFANRKLQLDKLTTLHTPDREEYIRLLTDWFNGEKDFIAELIKIAPEPERVFIKDFLDAIKALQQESINANCIDKVRNNKPYKEAAFRDFFKLFFKGRYPSAAISAEELMGHGHIDLKISEPGFTDIIIEFKGWWNGDKKKLITQIYKYLTQFENTGYILMINPLKEKNITESYEAMICNSETGFIPNSWEVHKAYNGDYRYFTSKHIIETKEKRIIHFIFDAYF